MADNSKWSNIKSKKVINDAKNNFFTKLVKETTVAARSRTEPAFNPRFRLAIQNDQVANRPKEAILRAISKANQGGLAAYHEVTYEGYGRHGAAIIVVCMTDKMIKTIANVRVIFTKYGSSLQKSGAITFFDHKESFTIPTADMKNQDDFTLGLIDAGAEALENDGAYIHVICTIEDIGKIEKDMETLAISPASAGLKYILHTIVQVSDAELVKLIKLIDGLRDDDDVQKAYHNITN